MANLGTISANKKRHADDSLESEQRLAKRFNLLNLGKAHYPMSVRSHANLSPTDHNGKLWIPATPPPRPTNVLQQEPVTRARTEPDDLMQVEDTKDRIYIHNLDEELEFDEDTPEEARMVFLGDVERHLDKIPKHILQGGTATSAPTATNQLVLYSVPSSLSVPEEQDSVRKVIIESRARVREQQERLAAEQMTSHDTAYEELHNAMVDEYGEDEDAMDIG